MDQSGREVVDPGSARRTRCVLIAHERVAAASVVNAVISRREFLDEVDRWIVDCRAQAIKMFDAGVEPPRALHLASQLATELAKRRALERFKRAMRELGPKRSTDYKM